LIEHLESRLGRLLGAWEPSEQSPEGTPSVGCFAGGVLAGIQCYATIGLFKTHLSGVARGCDSAAHAVAPEGHHDGSLGWDAFEEELVRQDPDLLDLQRAEIAL